MILKIEMQACRAALYAVVTMVLIWFFSVRVSFWYGKLTVICIVITAYNFFSFLSFLLSRVSVFCNLSLMFKYSLYFCGCVIGSASFLYGHANDSYVTVF